MRSVLPYALFAALLPGLCAAQTASTTIQAGDGNESTTLQSGQTEAVTIQVGDGNTATTLLSGTRNVSLVSQWGTSNTLTQSLSGSNQGLFSEQIGVFCPDRQGSTTRTGGTSRIGVTIRSELK